MSVSFGAREKELVKESSTVALRTAISPPPSPTMASLPASPLSTSSSPSLPFRLRNSFSSKRVNSAPASTTTRLKDVDVELGEMSGKKKAVRVDFKKGEKEKKKREVMGNDDFKLQNSFKIYMIFIWIPCLAVSIWYTVEIARQYSSAVANPTSTIIVDVRPRLPLPQVTICNWNQNGNMDDPAPIDMCDECELTFVSCTYNTTDDCHGLWNRRQYHTSAGIFSCYDFNAFPYDALYSATTGYAGSYATVWSFPMLPRVNPPENRAGIQISFYAAGQITPSMIYDEVRFAPVGYDSFYSLRLVNTIHSELPFYHADYNITAFETPVTNVNLMSRATQTVNNVTIGYVGISFAFQTLSQKTIYFGVSYSLESLFGDAASVIGTLCGFDTIKVAVGFGLAFICWKNKSIDLLADLFNG